VTPLRVGLSTCPNDTFLFHALLERRVDSGGLELDFVLADVQELNEALERGALDVGKASFATALRLAERYGVLRVGAALGHGVGPVLLARRGLVGPPRRVLAPGAGTTASLLLGCLRPDLPAPVQVRFDAILPALARGEADAGVAIHEGRFTYQRMGLTLLEDLGATWERETHGPVPLGGLLARHDLGAPVHAALNEVLARSLAAARAEPEAALGTMRRHAQELDEDVLWKHVELYVNEETTGLGSAGRRALTELGRRAGSGVSLAILG
jgi:1,4-dihydroxy-6-naphthoate synthase